MGEPIDQRDNMRSWSLGTVVLVAALAACSSDKPEVCGDGEDNDSDGLVDCADDACPGGTPCAPHGIVCAPDQTCGVCTGNGGPPEPAREASCSDGFDNDCDGAIDCADSSCEGVLCTTTTGAAGACTGGACVCDPTEDHETVCGDGFDQDCDGYVDCADRDCQPFGNGFGAVCDGLGHTCSVELGTGSRCTVCAGNGGRPERPEVSCGDGHDNDCDGLADCQDADCADVACNPDGALCDGTTRRCACGKSEPAGERTCDNGQDDDCDGVIDCADTDCQPIGAPGRQCASNGRVCTREGTCGCDGGGGVAEQTETRCADGFDNDCDGLADCVDLDCRPEPGQVYGASCDRVGTVGFLCSSSGACVCSASGEAVPSPELRCDNGVDDDCDGLPDCMDPSCRGATAGAPGRACDATGHLCDSATRSCSVCSGNGGAVELQEATCTDFADNDCDGLADCADPACLGQPCSAILTQYRCIARGGAVSCVDPLSAYSVVLSAGRTRLPADGEASTEIVATFTRDGAPIGSGSCEFSLDFAGPLLDESPGPVTRTTDPTGVARVVFRSTTFAGTYHVTAACSPPLQEGFVTGAVSIELPALWLLRVAAIQYPVMGARYSGFQEQGTVVFEALDQAGRPYPAGLNVTFTHPSQGESYVGLAPACADGAPPSCSADAATGEDGRATVQLTAGRRFALLSVRAHAVAGGVSTTALADDIAVVGAKPSGANLGLDCRPWNVPALTEHDCMVSKYAGPGTIVDCTLTMADRHGIVIGVPTLAGFWSEAGAAGDPVLTLPYVPESAGQAQPDLGRALGFVSVLGQPLPWDVDAEPGEYSRLIDSGCEPRFANPRDGLVTVIGLVAGEEGFVDRDGNGQYDAGEPFVDLGEPFVDADDDGVRDDSEPFQDVNEDFVYTGPNGQWDADTILWTETRIVYTGQPVLGELYSRIWDVPTSSPAIPPDFTPPAPEFTGSHIYEVYFADENFNPLSGLTKYAADTAIGNATAKVPNAPGDAESLGARFRRLYCAFPRASGGGIEGLGCHYGPAPTACTTVPCYVESDVSSFTLGTHLDLGVDCSPLPPGPDEAFVTATLNGVRSALSVRGTCP
jgi:hypothetical protein